MLCANNVFIPSHVWHITHRCHQNEFPLKYRRDRYRWLYRLFEARKRYGMCAQRHSNVQPCAPAGKRQGGEAIARSIQLVAGRTGQG
jgi:putative transposase